GPTAFHDVFTLPVTGTYTMVVDPRDQQTGTITFLLAPVPADTAAPAPPDTYTGRATGGDGNSLRAFAGAAAQKLTLHASNNTYAGGVDLVVRDHNRTFVPAQSVFGPTAFHDVFTLPVTGTYTMVVDPRDQQTGTITFLLAEVPAGVAAPAPPES